MLPKTQSFIQNLESSNNHCNIIIYQKGQMGLCDSKLPPDAKIKKDEKKVSEKLDEQLGTTSIGKKRSSTHNPNQQTNFVPLRFPYEICEQPLDPSNDRIKLISQNETDNLFVLKYIFGTGNHLNKITTRVQEYSKLKYAYLAPILQDQFEQNQVILRLNYYENRLKTLVIQNYSKCDLLMILYRIAKTIQYLEKHGIRHNKLEPSNIFLAGKDLRIVQVGLPSWTDPKEKETVSTRVLHISSLYSLFAIFFPQQAKNEQDLKALMQDMKNCSNNQLTIGEIVEKMKLLNYFDPILVIDDLKKVKITDENGNIYEGEANSNQNREGYGVLTESQSKYWGNWANNLRQNRGNLESKQAIFIGNWKDNKRDGFGLEIMKQSDEYYEGYYRDEKRNGFGIWEGNNGQIYIGSWKDNIKQGYGSYYDGKGLHYEGNWQNDMKNGNGKQTNSNGNTYQGKFKNNQKDGKGHLIHPGKFQYDGIFKENSITGFGTFRDRDGNEYVGDLVGGEYQGKGKFSNKDKTYFYEGQWKSGAKHGQGQQRSKDSVYIGTFVRNIRDGKGTLKELKQTYMGQFKIGKITGKGEYYYENGDKYKGYFVDKLKQGKGVYVSAADGSTYQGGWKKDKKHGKGKQVQKSGQYYEGDWVESKRDGFGVQYKDEKNKYEGHWKNDKKQGKGVQLQNGDRYEGDFKEGIKYSSFAKMIFNNGDRYQGGFVENRRQGKGKYTWANGDEYVGSFIANKREGQGKMQYKSTGVKYSGSWKDDKKQGHGVETQHDGQYVGEFVNNIKHGKGILNYKGEEGNCKLSGVWVKGLKHGEFEFFFEDGSYEKREYSNDREMNLGMTALPY